MFLIGLIVVSRSTENRIFLFALWWRLSGADTCLFVGSKGGQREDRAEGRLEGWRH